MKVVYDLPPKTRYDSFALDLEIFRARKEQLHRPYGDFASLGISDGKTVWMIEDVRQVEKALARIQGCRWIFHNAGFDLRHLRRWADVPCPKHMDLFWDTMLVERLLYGGWYSSFGLRDLARRRLQLKLDKETRDEYSKAKELTAQMRAYAAKDPWVTHRIFQQQIKELEADQPSVSCWQTVDAPFLWASLDFSGIMLDKVKWKKLADDYQAKADRISDELGFNPNSVPQVKAALAKAGLHPADTEEKTLLLLGDNKLVKAILDYREAAKRAGTYGDNVLAMVEDDGRIYTNIKVIGAETGRTASEGPNIQNQPNEEQYRSCYIAPRGWRFFSADYSKQEPCILAQISRDPVLLELLEQGENIYVEVSSTVYQRQVAELDERGHKSKEYKHGKALFLGLGYGLTAKGLAVQTGLPLNFCETMIQRFFTRMRGIRQYIDRYRALGQEDGYVRTLGGRRIWLNWYSYQAGNNAINGPMQGTGADMIKLSINKLHANFLRGDYGDKFPVIAPIHDEIIADAPAKLAKRVARDIQTAMEASFHHFCPDVRAKHIAEVSIGQSWAEKV